VTRVINRSLLAFLLIVLFGPRAQAQTINAASCSEADVTKALNSVTTDGTTVIIPACPSGASWSTQLSYTQTKSLTILGAGSTTGSDSLGNPTSYNDQTVLIYNGSQALINIAMATGKSLRISGISFKGGTGLTTNGVLNIGGTPETSLTSAPLLRIDHCHWYNFIGGNVVGLTAGWIYGVVDHSLFDLGQGSVTNGFRVSMSLWGGHQDSHGSWASPVNWGSGAAMFFENDTFNFGAANDCNNGGRQVFRYDTFNYSFIQAHEGSDERGCRSAEIYNNNFTGGSQSTNNLEYYLRMGSAISHHNTLNGVGGGLQFHYDRSEDPALMAHYQQAAPFGFGYAGNALWSGTVNTSGTSVTWASGTNFFGPGTNSGHLVATSNITIAGVNYTVQSVASSTSLTLTTSAGTQSGAAYFVNSNWDKNTDAASGYPALDQSGYGGGDLLQGTFPNICDTNSTDCANGVFTGRWPNEIQEPVYEWLNNYTGTNFIIGVGPGSNPALFQQNRDYFLYTSSFSGASGVGSGTLAARPTNCTPLVAYWATDTNTLYQCTATDTWTAYYTPYVYPHPLVQGNGNPPPPPPAPPTNLGVVVH
jgi:hypothetical protein